jgi:hypothetical protein
MFRDTMGVGAAFVTLALAVAAIGTLSTQGVSHPSRLWSEAAAVIALVGVVLVVVGWTGEHLTRTAPVSPLHAEALLGSARRLRDGLVAGSSLIDWGSGYRPRDAFHAHYPVVSSELEEWNALMAASGAAATALSERVDREARDVANRSEGRWALPRNVGSDIFRSTLTRARSGDLDAEFSIGDHLSWRPNVVRDEGESQEDWVARSDRNRARIEALGRASQGWPEAAAAGETYRRMDAFRQDRLPGVVQRLQLILEHGVPLVADGCPTCEGTPE